MTDTTVPPNHEARCLFFGVLGHEWPELGESLVAQVWPAYRALWRPAPNGCHPNARTFLIGFPNGQQFAAPMCLVDWPRLDRARTNPLRKALLAWARRAGIVDDWFLASALVTLAANAAHTEGVIRSRFVWRYSGRFHHSDRWGAIFSPALHEPIWFPRGEWDFGSWEHFERRMMNDFRRSLSAYRKSIMREWGLSKGNAANYARWTVARLSGLSWSRVVKRFAELQHYSEGETQAKKAVRQFAAEIGLTLAGSLADSEKKPAKTGRNQRKLP